MAKKSKCLLIADSSKEGAQAISEVLKNAGYTIQYAHDGKKCLEKIRTLKPDLVILDLLLTQVNGLDCLRAIRSDKQTAHIGVIVVTGKGLIQDYQAAVEAGANYYLIKPIPAQILLPLIDKFFKGTLKPDTFETIFEAHHTHLSSFYNPELPHHNSYVRFWGTRGSIPVSGIDYDQYGGNSPTLEVRENEHLVIIDAGTGIRPLGEKLLQSNIRELHLFIGHTHWDHIIGFPFFIPAYRPDFHIHIYGAKGFGKTLEELFTGMLDRDYFPVKFDELKAKMSFHSLMDGVPVTIGSLKISYEYCSHPGITLGFKIQSKYRSIGYITDNEMLVGYHGHPNAIDPNHPLLEPHRALLNMLQDCDLIVHEAQYTQQDYMHKVGWGHSSIANAAVLLKCTKATEWLVTHHDPDDTDTKLLEKQHLLELICKECNIPCSVRMAYDGLTIAL